LGNRSGFNKQLSFDELKPGPIPVLIEKEGPDILLLENVQHLLLPEGGRTVVDELPKVVLPRASGILLHITSLPGGFGIGELGKEAYRFADFLTESGQKIWQVLPLGPAGAGNSPYQCYSVFAGNPLMISFEKLVKQQLIDPADLQQLPLLPGAMVDYDAVRQFKLPLLKKSYRLFKKQTDALQRRRFKAFCRRNSYWLDDYALFMALKEANDGTAWNTWGTAIRERQSEAMAHWRRGLANEVNYYKYEQYIFFKQWYALKKYCHRCGIQIMGDITIYVALDSADVWAHQELFNLDTTGKPAVVAGVPPDYFSSTGQLWGNPLYRWDVMAQDGFAWWMNRIGAIQKMVDIVRLDHFRGFEKYWEVTASDTTAINGRWVPGPGARLFQTLQDTFGNVPIIAEDLGFITPEVTALRDQFNFPGLKVLQFAFSSGEPADYDVLQYSNNCVVYTGTHDNDTTAGWFHGSAGNTTQSPAQWAKERQRVLAYLGTDGAEINWDFIRLAMKSSADLAIFPLQDVLGLGSDTRMNIPGTGDGNWQWRFTPGMLTGGTAQKLKELAQQCGR
jgi:4-alpha-glucanotransferase